MFQWMNVGREWERERRNHLSLEEDFPWLSNKYKSVSFQFLCTWEEKRRRCDKPLFSSKIEHARQDDWHDRCFFRSATLILCTARQKKEGNQHVESFVQIIDRSEHRRCLWISILPLRKNQKNDLSKVSRQANERLSASTGEVYLRVQK